MNWSYYIGIGTSVVAFATAVALFNQWRRDKERLAFYSGRYTLRDMQLDSTLTQWERLNKEHNGVVADNLALSEKIGELQIELTLAHSRNEQIVEQLLAAEAKCHALQDELDDIFNGDMV